MIDEKPFQQLPTAPLEVIPPTQDASEQDFKIQEARALLLTKKLEDLTEEDWLLVAKDPKLKHDFMKHVDGQFTDKSELERNKRLRKERWPYCKERYGLQMKPVLDDIIKTGKSKEIKISKYPGWKIRTLSARIYQSKQYVLDWLDPLEVYKKLNTKLELRHNHRGVQLILLEDSPDLFFEDYEGTTSCSTLKQSITSFIEEAPINKKTTLPDDIKDMLPFTLTDKEKEELNLHCSKFSDILVCVVDTSKITLIKVQANALPPIEPLKEMF